MITFMVEKWADCWREMAPLWDSHHAEVAIHHEEVPLDPDVAEYARLCANGQLCIVVARMEGRIIGYFLSIIKPHLHYRTTLHAFTDVYYVLPEYREGTGCGIKLFKETERVWIARGVVKAFTATKLHLDMSAILLRMHWEHTEHTFCKLLKG